MFDGKGNRSVVLGEKWFAKRLTRGGCIGTWHGCYKAGLKCLMSKVVVFKTCVESPHLTKS